MNFKGTKVDRPADQRRTANIDSQELTPAEIAEAQLETFVTALAAGNDSATAFLLALIGQDDRSPTGNVNLRIDQVIELTHARAEIAHAKAAERQADALEELVDIIDKLSRTPGGRWLRVRGLS